MSKSKTASSQPSVFPYVVRADLHCHSVASTEADEAVLNAIQCPECYSEPEQVYAQAKRRGMTFSTITDHDCIDGVLALGGREDVFVGEEVTCYFPEDHCKMHVLVWGLDRVQHDALQQRAEDVYAVAAYIEQQNLAHSVAHPVYRQNDVLERWHLERLFLIFKGFECLNGAHSQLHRDSFEPMLDELSPRTLVDLSSKHKLPIRWGTDAWRKARTGGSDDHGLFNVGRTWTEFPADVRTTGDVLQALRDGRCKPGGEAGSSLKLAHNFYGVGIRYLARNLAVNGGKRTMTSSLLESLVGDRPIPRRRDVAVMAIKGGLRAAGRRVMIPFSRRSRRPLGTALLQKLFVDSLRSRAAEREPLTAALRTGDAPLGQHESFFKLISGINRDIGEGIATAIGDAMTKRELAPIFDTLSTIAAHQFVQLPYYFALFHQNRERHLLKRITGWQRARTGGELRVGLFTDSFDGEGDVARYVRAIGERAEERGRSLTVATTSCTPKVDATYRKNFEPLISRSLASDPQLPMAIPPLAEVLEWADRQQFDAIHVATPGPMGLCGWVVAKMLKVPLVLTHHVDPAAAVQAATGDFRLTSAAAGFGAWWTREAAHVITRSRAARAKLAASGVVANVSMIGPSVDHERFNPSKRDPSLWASLGIRQPIRLLYRGRVSNQEGAKLLAAMFLKLCTYRSNAALIVAGEGPDVSYLRRELAKVPAYFVESPSEDDLPRYLASADLLLCPTTSPAPAQTVVEAQACGLPALVSAGSGPSEVVDDGLTGLVLPANDANAWGEAIQLSLCDEPARLRMSRTAPSRTARFAGADAFKTFWDAHVRVALPDASPDVVSKTESDELLLTPETVTP